MVLMRGIVFIKIFSIRFPGKQTKEQIQNLGLQWSHEARMSQEQGRQCEGREQFPAHSDEYTFTL